MLFDEPQLSQHTYSVPVHSRQTDVGVVPLDPVVDSLSVEVAVAGLEDLKNEPALPGEAAPFPV